MSTPFHSNFEAFQFSGFDPVILLKIGTNPQNLLECLSETDCDWRNAPLYQRDQALAALFYQLFGDSIQSRAVCENCHQPYQVDFLLSELSAAVISKREKEAETFKLPTVEMINRANKDEIQLLALMFEDSANIPEQKDATFWEMVERQNPILDLDLDSTCPNCEGANVTRYSHVHFFARRLQMTLSTLLDEIHLIASNYHWTKDEICQLGASTRAGLVARIRKMQLNQGARLEAVQA